jgi:hypothetical protein
MNVVEQKFSQEAMRPGKWKLPRCEMTPKGSDPGTQQTHQDVKGKVSRSGTESHGIEARVRKKRPRRVLHEFSEAVDGGNSLVSGGTVVQAK